MVKSFNNSISREEQFLKPSKGDEMLDDEQKELTTTKLP
jgi:hypothetical protein